MLPRHPAGANLGARPLATIHTAIRLHPALRDLTIALQQCDSGRPQTHGRELRIRRLGVRIPPGAQGASGKTASQRDIAGTDSVEGHAEQHV